jgi:hypothetical protein
MSSRAASEDVSMLAIRVSLILDKPGNRSPN